MEIAKSSFEDLEKQLAKDALEKALKDLHNEIIREIERNKISFSENINKSLNFFKTSLEQNISETLDQKIAFHLEKNFENINSQLVSNFDEKFSSVLKQTEDDMQSLRKQGESTLTSWREMMLNYKDLWTKPFFIVFVTAILTGMVISLFSSYLLMRKQRETLKHYEAALTSHRDTIQWMWIREKERETKENKGINKNKKKWK